VSKAKQKNENKKNKAEIKKTNKNEDDGGDMYPLSRAAFLAASSALRLSSSARRRSLSAFTSSAMATVNGLYS
jgi:hypothetical protein